ncbi:MAG: Dihydroorotate dehydrogenase [bacterium ADurb.Bin429]|nr:MAG: Dihydroorotate dehydrogenase [bacterium ADurb.Bin429]
MDAEVDGITLGAGLHLGSLELMKEHPRFSETLVGIIVSSARALKLFLTRAARVGRLPDYIVVEGPLAGGHLGFPENWQDFDLRTILREVCQLLESTGQQIPVIAAGGIFTGADGLAMMAEGAAGIQVATRFAVTRESGLPDHVKQAFFAANEDDVVVNTISATGYPMRMLRQSPAIGSLMPPQCESLGYALDGAGHCSYLDAYEHRSTDKTCLCAHMRNYTIWTCGHTVSRLKDTAVRLPDGTYEQPAAAEVLRDYLTNDAVPEQVLAQAL